MNWVVLFQVLISDIEDPMIQVKRGVPDGKLLLIIPVKEMFVYIEPVKSGSSYLYTDHDIVHDGFSANDTDIRSSTPYSSI